MIPFANSQLWGEKDRTKYETFLKDFEGKCKLSGL